MGKIWRSPSEKGNGRSSEAGRAGGSTTSKVILQTLGMLVGAAALLVLVGTWLSDFQDHPVAPPQTVASTTSTPISSPLARAAASSGSETSSTTPRSSTTEPSSTIEQPSAKKATPPYPPSSLPATPTGAATPGEATTAGVSTPQATPITPSPASAVPSPASAVPSDTALSSWTVRPGDDLWSIAAEVLGRTVGGMADQDATTVYWRTLVAANGRVLADPNLLHPGQILTLPAVDASLGQQTSTAAAPPSPSPAAGTPAITWTVQPGDNLWSIAQAVVRGTSAQVPSRADTRAYWRTLVAANSSVVANPDLLYAGQILTLPSLRE